MKIVSFIKKEKVFFIALLLAVVSCFFVKPSKAYIGYINFDVLYILFSLMGIVSGLQFCGVFVKCANVLCQKVHDLRSLSLVLVLLPFFFSMIITNDVALLTFVPFTILIITMLKKEKYLIFIIVLQTLAANLGSMFLPMGNPQNLYLFTKMNVPLSEFCKSMIPYSLTSLFLLLVSLLVIPKERLDVKIEKLGKMKVDVKVRLSAYIVLFVISLLAVLHFISAWILALLTFLFLILFDRKTIKKVDNMLLLTFCAFFVFTGNIGNIESIKAFLESKVHGNEFIVSLIISQGISNVPATLLLEPFSVDKFSLLNGVNVGGLGTVIASLASLISYKLYASSSVKGKSGGKYMIMFTVLNVMYLIPLVLLYFVIRSH